jgi:hypothetical protein
MTRSRDKRARIGAESSKDQRHIRWARSVRSFWEQERAELESGVADVGTIPWVKLDDRLFAELTELAQVPAAGVERLRRNVSYELSFFKLDRERPTTEPVEAGSKKRALIQLRRSTQLSQELSAILLNLDRKAEQALYNAAYWRRHRAREKEWERNFAQRYRGDKRRRLAPDPNFPEWDSHFNNFQRITDELAGLSSEALSFLQAKPRPRPRGRPRGGAFSKILARSLVEFTLRLLLDVRAAGGQLTVDKNLGEGTLLDALNLLRPYLPRWFPRKLPVGNLDKVRTLDRKIAHESPL